MVAEDQAHGALAAAGVDFRSFEYIAAEICVAALRRLRLVGPQRGHATLVFLGARCARARRRAFGWMRLAAARMRIFHLQHVAVTARELPVLARVGVFEFLFACASAACSTRAGCRGGGLRGGLRIFLRPARGEQQRDQGERGASAGVHRGWPRSISASSAAATCVGPFHHRHVAAVVEQHAPRLRDARSVQRERAGIDHRVLPAPQQQRGLLDARGFVAGQEAFRAAADRGRARVVRTRHRACAARCRRGRRATGCTAALPRDGRRWRGSGRGSRDRDTANGLRPARTSSPKRLSSKRTPAASISATRETSSRMAGGDERRDAAAHRMPDEHDGLVRRDAADERREALALREEAVVLARHALAFAPAGQIGNHQPILAGERARERDRSFPCRRRSRAPSRSWAHRASSLRDTRRPSDGPRLRAFRWTASRHGAGVRTPCGSTHRAARARTRTPQATRPPRGRPRGRAWRRQRHVLTAQASTFAPSIAACTEPVVIGW